MPDAHGGQKRASDSLGLESQDRHKLSCGCWGWNLGPPEKQAVLLPAKLTFRALSWYFKRHCASFLACVC